MTALFMVVAVCAAAVGAGYLVLGVRQWHGKGRPLSYGMRDRTLKDAEALAGWDRCVIPAGLACLSAAVLIANGAISGTRLAGASGVVAACSVIGVIVFAALAGTIINFNRPKFLVPPHLRDQLGAIAGRRQRRRQHEPML